MTGVWRGDSKIKVLLMNYNNEMGCKGLRENKEKELHHKFTSLLQVKRKIGEKNG